MDYLEWNRRLGTYFFNNSRNGQLVLLCVTRDVIQAIGSSEGQGIPEFINALKTCRIWGGRVDASMTGLALSAYNAWLKSSKTSLYPYYLGYLSFFALAAAEAEGSYYASLWQLWDGSQDYRWPNNWDRMLDLWEDLEYWCNVEHEGKLGRFKYGGYGSWIYAGVPITQTILTEEERKILGRIFAKAGFDPDSPPSDKEIEEGIRKYGTEHLNRRTIRILEGSSGLDKEFRLALIDMLRMALNECNFDNFYDPENYTEDDTLVFRSARLSVLSTDKVAGEVRFIVRIKSNPPLPEEGVIMTDSEGNKYEAIPCVGSISFPVQAIRDGRKNHFTPVLFDWTKPFRFHCNSREIVIPGREVRIFHLGIELGINEWIEYPSLRPIRKVIVACSQNAIKDIDSWGQQFCPGWERLNFNTGMPHGWKLFFANSVSDTRSIENKYPQLHLPTDIKIRLVGGLSIRRQYLPGMLPSVEVSGNSDKHPVTINSKIADQDLETGLFKIPIEEQPSWRFVIQVENGCPKPPRLSFQTIDLKSTPLICPPYITCSGKPLSEKPNSIWIQGPLVFGLTDESSIKWNLNKLGIKSIEFIGRKPSEILSTRLSSLPDWEPVWAITKGRKRRVIFCSVYLPSECYPLNSKTHNRKALRRWKRVIYGMRKRISLPSEPELVALWNKYVEAAFNVDQ